MKRQLVRSATFIRAAKKTVKKRPQVTEDIRTALELLADDAMHPKLKTHKLKGKFAKQQQDHSQWSLRLEQSGREVNKTFSHRERRVTE